MLLNPGPTAEAYWAQSMGYNTETLLDDVSKQMAASNLLRRHSRGASGQKAGGSMRIAKPASAGISPRTSTMINRRKTLMSDSPHRRRPLMFDQNSLAVGSTLGSHDRMQAPPLSNRPMSWHASSHMAPPSSCYTGGQYQMSGLDFNGGYNSQDLAPTPAVYSGYASPASTFSPLSQPFTDYEQEPVQYRTDSFFPNTINTTNHTYQSYHAPEMPQQVESHSFSSADNMDPALYSHFDWSNFAANGFDSTTAPPTPKNFLPIQQPDTAFENEEAIPYHSLEDCEPGEVLVGMGLYDTPEKSPAADPHLDNYRALMMSQLLGSAYKKPESPVSTGKGLKLEETWNPPPSDDGEDDEEDGDNEEDGDDDAEGSDDDDTPEDAVTDAKLAPQQDPVAYSNQNSMVVGIRADGSHFGWL